MTLREIHAKADSLSNYWAYIVIMFFWYFLNNVYSSNQFGLSESPIEPLNDWTLRLLLAPIILAGMVGGIHEEQSAQDLFAGNQFFSGIKSNFLRFISANIFYLVLAFIAAIAAVLLSGIERSSGESGDLLIAMIAVPFSAINLFWLCAVVIERNIFRGLRRAVKTTLTNPLALALGIIWAAVAFTDTIKRKNRFVLRSAIAITVDGFFTVIYLLILAALLLGRPVVSDAPGYQFLKFVEPDLAPYVVLLEHEELGEFE